MKLSRNLPVGIQTFEKLRDEGCLYVDKTAFVWQLASTATPYFLSRPRRFGKSLLLSTFKSYFEGRKDLFEGLAIEKLETKWEKYPVLHLDLNAEKYEDVKRLNYILGRHLNIWEDAWGKDEREITPSDRFSGVIRRAYEHTGKGVVVLIDEYDKPLLQTLLDEELTEAYKKVLKAFYGVLKSTDEYLRFVFLTGVTKFAQVSVFSDLNQLNDISMKPQYATLCGITKEELIEVFTPELEELGRQNELTFEETVDKMTAMYDGYHFCEFAEGMFNPFSVLNVLKSGKFDYYWFATGTPTFLTEILKKTDFDLRELDGIQVSMSSLRGDFADYDSIVTAMYQSGYLTIKGYDKEFQLYTLGYPNEEVRYGFLKLLTSFSKEKRNINEFMGQRKKLRIIFLFFIFA